MVVVQRRVLNVECTVFHVFGVGLMEEVGSRSFDSHKAGGADHTKTLLLLRALFTFAPEKKTKISQF